jgi:hypothetical protein
MTVDTDVDTNTNTSIIFDTSSKDPNLEDNEEEENDTPILPQQNPDAKLRGNHRTLKYQRQRQSHGGDTDTDNSEHHHHHHHHSAEKSTPEIIVAVRN